MKHIARLIYLMLFLSVSLAQTPITTEIQKLTSSDVQAGDLFGNVMAISEDGKTLVVTALKANDQKGGVYIFENEDGWQEKTILTVEDGAESDQFGFSIAIDTDTLVIGADQHDELGLNSGAVYVFNYSDGEWIQESKLLASDGALADRFGASVDLQNDLIVVGAPEDDDGGSNSGSAYVFRKVNGTWQEVSKLVAKDADKGDAFGTGVAIQGSQIFVGATLDDTSDNDTGSVYVFEETSTAWQHSSLLVPETLKRGYKLGRTIAANQDLLALGTEYAFENQSTGEEILGTVFVYRFIDGKWLEETKLFSHDQSYQHRLGWSVESKGDYLIAGSPGDDFEGRFTGSVYLYEYNNVDKTWYEVEKFIASDAARGQGFGAASILSDSHVFVSAFENNTVYIFELPK